VTRANAAEFLALPNVLCVGGSWIVPSTAVDSGDWGTIEALARDAATLRDAVPPAVAANEGPRGPRG
jgi:2-dehydro-3-deoxyphosphogluconate aldolase/(4S)-4-hydroxy-2-oxoglutarate aldolase